MIIALVHLRVTGAVHYISFTFFTLVTSCAGAAFKHVRRTRSRNLIISN